MTALTPDIDSCETSSQNKRVDDVVEIIGKGSIDKTKSSEAVVQVPFPRALSVKVTWPLTMSLAEGVYVGFWSLSLGLKLPLPEVLH